jgi:hypothetical protein
MAEWLGVEGQTTITESSAMTTLTRASPPQARDPRVVPRL